MHGQNDGVSQWHNLLFPSCCSRISISNRGKEAINVSKGMRNRILRQQLKEQAEQNIRSLLGLDKSNDTNDESDQDIEQLSKNSNESQSIENEKYPSNLEAENALLKDMLAKALAKNAELEILNNWYLEQFRISQLRRFGASSEKTQLQDQMSLFNEAETTADCDTADETETISYKRKKRKGKREDFYKDLPTEKVVHELPEEERICPICGGLLHECGHEVVRREVEVIPAQIRAVEHVQTVYGCRNCEQSSGASALPMVKAPVPAPVIAGSGIASPSLLALVLCNKFVLALPLYRQEQELQRMNINISRQTMANWIIYAAQNWLKPIYDLLHEVLLLSEILHGDETRLQVIKEEGRKASQNSYMWVYCTGKYEANPIVLFEYQPTREGKHPLAFLAGYSGYLHVDAYSGYLKLTEQGVTLSDCWSHMRRKFDEALKALRKEERKGAAANIGFKYCNQLFELERKYDEEGIGYEERHGRRQLEAKPIAEAFFAWAESMYAQIVPNSKIEVAITYALNQRQRLMNYFLDGRLEMSNNRCEQKIRPFTIGRNNWQFAYSEKGATASAIVYSIVETAQDNGLVPFMYLKLLFETLPNIPRNQFADYLPWSPIVQDICKTPTIKK